MTDNQEMSSFAQTIMRQKYLHDGEETWEDIASRVVDHVVTPYFPEFSADLKEAIGNREFMPGGRYLAATGLPFNQTQNCLLLTVEDSRESISDLMQRASNGLMTGAGVGVVWSALRERGAVIGGNHGYSTGPCAFMQSLNELGRGIMNGGSRRAAIWAGLHWNHPDVFEFMSLKDWDERTVAAKAEDFSAYAPMDMTNISVILDDAFFEAYHDETHPQFDLAQRVYWTAVEKMLLTGEPGFSVDVGENAGEHLRNACVAGDTELLTRKGYRSIAELAGTEVDIWNGFEWSAVHPKITGFDQPMVRVQMSDGRSLRCTPDHKFEIATDYLGSTKRVEAACLSEGDKLIKHDLPVIEGGSDVEWAYTQGFISADGMDNYSHFSLYGEKVALQEFMHLRHVGKYQEAHDKVSVYPSFDKLPKAFVPHNWSVRSRLDWLAGYFDGDGCVLKEGGVQAVSTSRTFLADVQKMLTTLGIQSKVTHFKDAHKRPLPNGRGGYKEYECSEAWRLLIGAAAAKRLAEMGMTTHRLKFGHQPNRDASRFVTVVSVEESGVEEVVYCFNEPKRHLGLFDGVIAGQCTEVTSKDDNDICNLGSINLARVDDILRFSYLVELGTVFLLCGTLYSKVPYEKVAETRTKNRRLGLGLMGVYEWLVKRGYRYEPNDELAQWLERYTDSTLFANYYADKLGISRPVKTRAIAPTGTIGILAETTTGIEPLFALAYKRRYLRGDRWHYQYVVDATAQRIIDQGADPESLETAYDLAKDPDRRLRFQAFVQQYVDHGISSTLNLPAPDQQPFTAEEFGGILMQHLPELRGVTTYPDGARGGQPLNVVPYAEAAGFEGYEYEEFGSENACVSGVCGV